ncbi:MAG: hypothetical protein U0527_02060 [Candidatus Eisenbacteria bacterium]
MTRTLAAFSALLLVAVTGCSRDRLSPAPTTQDPAAQEQLTLDHDCDGLLALAGARLSITTDDPDQVYVQDDKDAWLARSVLTHATSFHLLVKNEGDRNAQAVELLVAIPSGLPDFGWSVTVGEPGLVLSKPSDFPLFRLNQSAYPQLPHGVYGPRGVARYVRFPGPGQLKPGETWSIPVQLYRGTVEEFKVHFDAGSRRYWSPPTQDVTAIPPVEENFR